MMEATIKKQDVTAKWLIGIFSVVVFLVVVVLGKVKISVNLGFDVHLFAAANAFINSTIAILLIAGLITVKRKMYGLHKQIMIVALALSVLFLLCYIAHHLFSSETHFGGSGSIRIFYYALLVSHIFLAAVILPFILFTAYRGLTAEFDLHRKIARITWPIWLYVAVTGPIVYWMIHPYYQ